MEKGEVIGKGRTAEVIYWGNNRVLKLFYKDFPSSIIDYQYKVDTLIGKIFPNCPKALEKIEENGRIGILYEYIEGIVLREFMGKKIKSVGKALRMLAEIHVEMHKYEIKDINSQKNSFKLSIQQTDVARTFYVLKYGLAPSDEYTLKKSFLHRFFFKAIKSLVAKTYIKHYLKLTGKSMEEIKKWNLAIFATRLRDPVPLEYDNLLKMINNSLKHYK